MSLASTLHIFGDSYLEMEKQVFAGHLSPNKSLKSSSMKVLKKINSFSTFLIAFVWISLCLHTPHTSHAFTIPPPTCPVGLAKLFKLSSQAFIILGQTGLGGARGFGPPKFQMNENECLFNKCTFNVYVNCSWRCPGTST